MGSAKHRALIGAAVVDAVEVVCKARRPRAPTISASRPSGVSRQATAPAIVQCEQSIRAIGLAPTCDADPRTKPLGFGVYNSASRMRR